MSNNRILVVGTTPDYISYIDTHVPGRVLFLSDSLSKESTNRLILKNSDEIVCNLQDFNQSVITIVEYLEEHLLDLSGVACYDCEWLSLAAMIAENFNLPFPSVASIKISRNKYLTKIKWKENDVRCPKVELVYNNWQAFSLVERFGGPVVLKPLSGTGSELTFKCQDKNDLTSAYREIKVGLAQRSQQPLYKVYLTKDKQLLPDYPILAEEFIEGNEFSADFIIENDNLTIIRIAKKFSDKSLPFGTTTAYVVPAKLPEWLSYEILSEKLYMAAKTLGFQKAICMVDFMISNNEIVFIELTPRIGGDCLPNLIKRSSGIDTIKLALDFAEGYKINIPPFDLWKEHIGLRLFAQKSGILLDIKYDIPNDNRLMKDVFLKYSPGHKVTMPPEDYETWILGHVIFESESESESETPLLEQCMKINNNITVNMVQNHVNNIC